MTHQSIFNHPKDYLLQAFKQHDVVLLAEDHAVKTHLDFVKDLIPDLHAAGVYYLAMEFGASEDQDTLNQLLTGKTFDRNLARTLMFHYNVRWAYKEYLDLYEAVWRLNQIRPKNTAPFLLINMSYIFDWSDYNGVRTKENLQRVFHKGPIDEYRAKIIMDIKQADEKILILTGTVHALKHPLIQSQSISENDLLKTKWLGEHLYDAYGDRVTNLLFHQPLEPLMEMVTQKQTTPSPTAFVEQHLSKPAGFDLKKYATHHDRNSHNVFDFFAHFFDGYLYVAPLHACAGATVDEHFLDEQSFSDVLAQWPDKDWTPAPKNEKDYWQIIHDYVDLKKRYTLL